MSKIAKVHGREILDSRGNPTVQVEVHTECGLCAISSVPSGASTGELEAVELRDGDKSRYGGKGVTKAVANVNGTINEALCGKSVFDQRELDMLMIELDGTKNKSNLGANAILGTSLSISRAGALAKKEPLYRYIANGGEVSMPIPMMNIINGGEHADNSLDFQEFMIHPIGASSFKEAVRYGSEVFHTLKSILKEAGHIVSVGDEGGFAPNLGSNEEALQMIVEAIQKAGYTPGKDITIAIDPAASEFFDNKKKVYYEKKKKKRGESFKEQSPTELIAYLEKLITEFPIDIIEDGLGENDWDGWKELTAQIGNKMQLVGDDIFVTNKEIFQKGIDLKVGNSILIKLNQIGTVTETIDTIKLAHEHNYQTVVSHRSGETEDAFIADFVVGMNAKQIKTGSLSRSDRVAKYNRLIAIEEEL